MLSIGFYSSFCNLILGKRCKDNFLTALNNLISGYCSVTNLHCGCFFVSARNPAAGTQMDKAAESVLRDPIRPGIPKDMYPCYDLITFAHKSEQAKLQWTPL